MSRYPAVKNGERAFEKAAEYFCTTECGLFPMVVEKLPCPKTCDLETLALQYWLFFPIEVFAGWTWRVNSTLPVISYLQYCLERFDYISSAFIRLLLPVQQEQSFFPHCKMEENLLAESSFNMSRHVVLSIDDNLSQLDPDKGY